MMVSLQGQKRTNCPLAQSNGLKLRKSMFDRQKNMCKETVIYNLVIEGLLSLKSYLLTENISGRIFPNFYIKSAARPVDTQWGGHLSFQGLIASAS